MESLFRDVPHTGINFERYDQIAVKVSGLNDPPPPVNTFEEVNLGPQFKANIRRAGFTKPTPVQKYTFPIVLNGGDLMACAQTGSGKTVSVSYLDYAWKRRGEMGWREENGQRGWRGERGQGRKRGSKKGDGGGKGWRGERGHRVERWWKGERGWRGERGLRGERGRRVET